jgi:hypothetical protein
MSQEMIMRFIGIALALSSVIVVPASAQMVTSIANEDHSRPIFVPREAIDRQYIADLQSLRQKALALKQQQGGELSPASFAEFQTRLDKINTFYRRRLRDVEILSVDANGNSIR